MDSDLVIKVKYGDTLRRFGVSINVKGTLDMGMSGLLEKIRNFFKLTANDDITLTYVDEDEDVVTLVDDNDLRDAIGQCLNPLRINVTLNTINDGMSDTRSSERSSSSKLQSDPLSHVNSGVSEVLKSLPEPLSDILVKLSSDLASKAVSSAPVLNELIERLAATGLTSFGPASKSQGGTEKCAESNGSDTPMENKESGDLGSSENLVSNPDVLPRTKSAGKDKAKLAEGNASANVSRGVGTSVSPSSTVRQVVNFSNEFGYGSLNNNAPLDPQSNGVPVAKKKVTQKRDFHFNGKSNIGHSLSSSIDTPMHSNPFSGDKLSGFLTGDKEKVPGRSASSSASHFDSYPQGSCPFTGTDVVDTFNQWSPVGGYSSHPSRRSYRHEMGRIFHKGIRCDGCGVHPITGPRFKSKVKEDYDLCNICFAEMGCIADYIRMDRPVSRRLLTSKDLPELFSKILPDMNSEWLPNLPPPHTAGFEKKICRPQFDSCFVQDVNVLDGTVIAPSTSFTKIWRMRNNGSSAWPHGTQLVWIGGNHFSKTGTVSLEMLSDGCRTEEELDVAVDFTAPERPGRYISYWRMALPSGQKFGQRVWVLIQVDTPIRHPSCEKLHGLNLNLPPECSGPEGQSTDMDVDPVCAGDHEIDTSRRVTETIPVVDNNQRSEVHDAPVNDSLQSENDSVHESLGLPALASYPTIDISNSPSAPLKVDTPVSTDVGEVDESKMVEETLLKELEEMGFKQVDLNKEILRMNEYDLEKSVDDLCGVSEWDPILEELREMGFDDKETNKKLLAKNGGSIKRVVMDLVAGEKA